MNPLKGLLYLIVIIFVQAGCAGEVDKESSSLALLVAASLPSSETGPTEGEDALETTTVVLGTDITVSETDTNSDSESGEKPPIQSSEDIEKEFDAKFGYTYPDESEDPSIHHKMDAIDTETPESVQNWINLNQSSPNQMKTFSIIPVDSIAHLLRIPLNASGTDIISIPVYIIPGDFPVDADSGMYKILYNGNSIVFDTTLVAAPYLENISNTLENNLLPLSFVSYSYFFSINGNQLLIGLPFELNGQNNKPLYGRVVAEISFSNLQTQSVMIEFSDFLFRGEMIAINPIVEFQENRVHLTSGLRYPFNTGESCFNLSRLIGSLDLYLESGYQYGSINLTYTGLGPSCNLNVDNIDTLRIRFKPNLSINIFGDQFSLNGSLFAKDVTTSGRSATIQFSATGVKNEMILDKSLTTAFSIPKFVAEIYGTERIEAIYIGLSLSIMTANPAYFIAGLAASEKSFQTKGGILESIKQNIVASPDSEWVEKYLKIHGIMANDFITMGIDSANKQANLFSTNSISNLNLPDTAYFGFQPTTGNYTFDTGVALFVDGVEDSILNKPDGIPALRYHGWSFKPMKSARVNTIQFLGSEDTPFRYENETLTMIQPPKEETYLLAFQIEDYDGSSYKITRTVSILPPLDSFTATFDMLDTDGNKNGYDDGILSLSITSEIPKPVYVQMWTAQNTGSYSQVVPVNIYSCDSEGICNRTWQYHIYLNEAISSNKRYYYNTLYISVKYGDLVRNFQYDCREWRRRKYLTVF